MLSGRLLMTKWIKHVTAQIGSVHQIWLKCENSSLKKPFFQPIINFPHKVFWTWFMALKRLIKVHKSSRHRVMLSERIVTNRTRTKTVGALLSHITINTPHNQVLGISTTRPRMFLAYLSAPHHHAASYQTSLLRTTYTHSTPDPYLVEEKCPYLFNTKIFIYLEINEIKSTPLIHCLLQPYVCL